MYEYEEEYETYTPPTPKQRASATVGHDATFHERNTEAVPRQQAPPKKHHHYLFWIGIGMCLFLAGFVFWNMVVAPWIHGLELQWHYGDQRVSVFGADVGHGGVSRFIAFDSDNEIVIVEVVAKKYSVYTIPATIVPNQLITMSVAD